MPNASPSMKETVRGFVDKVRRRLFPFSDYDQTIPPEIVDDEFYAAIRSMAGTVDVRTMLEIGSSTGEGSTRAFVEGLSVNPYRPTLFCMEVSRPRFKTLVNRYGSASQVKCYNYTSVPLESFPTEAEVIDFYRGRESLMSRVPLREVLRWLRQDVRYVGRLGGRRDGIRMIKEENDIERFGMVLIDGSEFTGSAELDEVYGADYILLDDIGTFKNLRNYERLLADHSYQLRSANKALRNGYAIFERRPAPTAEDQAAAARR